MKCKDCVHWNRLHSDMIRGLCTVIKEWRFPLQECNPVSEIIKKSKSDLRDNLINAIDILDGTKPNPEHNSQMLWNGEHTYLRGLLVKCVHLVDKQKDDIECWQEVIKKFQQLPGLRGFWEMKKGQDVKVGSVCHRKEYILGYGECKHLIDGVCDVSGETIYDCLSFCSRREPKEQWISIQDKIPPVNQKIWWRDGWLDGGMDIFNSFVKCCNSKYICGENKERDRLFTHWQPLADEQWISVKDELPKLGQRIKTKGDNSSFSGKVTAIKQVETENDYVVSVNLDSIKGCSVLVETWKPLPDENWINVKDELPKLGKQIKCLVSARTPYIMTGTVTKMRVPGDGAVCFYLDNADYYYIVSKWKPLPEKKKEEKFTARPGRNCVTLLYGEYQYCCPSPTDSWECEVDMVGLVDWLNGVVSARDKKG